MDFSPFSLESYHYDLDPKLIAQEPPAERGGSRLMVLDRFPPVEAPRSSKVIHAQFTQLAQFLPPKALLVVNNSRVSSARLFGTRPGGKDGLLEARKIEMLLLSPPPLLEREAQGEETKSAPAEVLLKPGRAAQVGDRLDFGTGLWAEVLEKRDFGKHLVQLFWQGSLMDCMDAVGVMPLPPYIKRPGHTDCDDRTRYQTCYARLDKTGSVAAPTAGLHFTPIMKTRLLEQGFDWAELTLHVGYGTFSPVRTEDLREHVMHPEYVELPAQTAKKIAEAQAQGRSVVAVGTTACRTLEGCFEACGEIPSQGWDGWTKIFMYPGYKFQVVDGLLTNFHLPKSTLLMLVSAFAGRERVLDAYAQAVQQQYRFFSYGDAMLIR